MRLFARRARSRKSTQESTMQSSYDPEGSYTGQVESDPYARPVQDADDL